MREIAAISATLPWWGARDGKVADFPISGGSYITYLAGPHVCRSWPGIRLKVKWFNISDFGEEPQVIIIIYIHSINFP
jgi:hypothetical protein